VFWDEPPSGVDPEAIVRRMTGALAHRGPDGEGVVRGTAPAGNGAAAPLAVLGHRRLSIIDLSQRAAQPMASGRAPIWLTYNGEVYNFKTLRRELEDLGQPFRSDSDTEVILRGYEQWGERVVDRLRGMFAFALWDGRTGTLFAARDRLGVKPLYVYQAGRCLLFGSEIRSLLASGIVPRRLDLTAVAQYLEWQTVPSPRTLVDGVRMIAPGSHVTFSRDGATERRYWDLLESAQPSGSDADGSVPARRVRELLVESAGLHLVSDVPVGVFLSGGIDSSAVAALVRLAGVVPRTFCVSFPGTSFDEGPLARRVALAVGADHTEIVLSEDEVRQQLPEALAGVDHPSGDGVNTFVVSRAVRAAGVKVALSGLGGDELFGGYPSFRRLRRLAGYARLWRWSPAPVRRAAAAAVRTLGGTGTGVEKAAALLETDASLPQAYGLTRQLFSVPWRAALIGRERVDAAALAGTPYVALVEDARARAPRAGLMSLVSYAEARTYMHDVLLRDTDQMSMAHGLEVRVPLLDHRLAEYVMGLPDEAKRPDERPKRLLMAALGEDLPSEIAEQPKRGFVLPLDLWMRGDLRTFCEHHLGSSGLAGRAPFRSDAVRSVWQAFLKNDGRVTWSRPWTLVALNAWMEQTGVVE
jgi:asparagine synthase (glutamine-hydrolysing)